MTKMMPAMFAGASVTEMHQFSDPMSRTCGLAGMLCYAMLCYAMLCYAMLCYAMLCYAMLCYAMLCYAIAPVGWSAYFWTASDSSLVEGSASAISASPSVAAAPAAGSVLDAAAEVPADAALGFCFAASLASS